MLSDLVQLVCGQYASDKEFSGILDHLGAIVGSIGQRCLGFLAGESPDDLSIYGPYCARTLLEAACSVYIGRLDPLRLLAIKRQQERPSYTVATRNSLSIQWKGDVVPKNPPINSWDDQEKHDKAFQQRDSRALLGFYNVELYLAPAFTILIDYYNGNSAWINELKKIPPEGIRDHLRIEAERLYSSLSKGIHPEFVVPPEAIYDQETVKEYLTKSISFVVKLGCIINSVPTVTTQVGVSELERIISSIEAEVGIS